MGLINELYKEYEVRNLEAIADCSSEIGLMLKIKETFKADSKIQQLADYFIRVSNHTMEAIYAEIEEHRRFSKEFSGLSR